VPGSCGAVTGEEVNVTSRIVAHAISSDRVIKGLIQDPFPPKEVLIIELEDAPPAEDLAAIRMKDLKAVFFVNSFEGQPDYDETFDIGPARRPGQRAELVFNDGEIMVVYCEGYDPDCSGFFVYPTDLKSNNRRIYVVNSSLRSVTFME
jgi:hypothetical protein